MSGRVVIVTGASSGIGEATARRLLTQGEVVYAFARRREQMAPLGALGAQVVTGDVSEEGDVVALVARVLAEHGHVDALVNNAGYGSYGAIEEVPIEEARRQFEVNLFGLARLTQLVLPTMRAQRSGTVVNISSVGGRVVLPLGGWYYATKFALEALSDALRVELAPFKVRVVVVEPGLIRSEWGAVAAQHLLESSASGPYAEAAAMLGPRLAAGSSSRRHSTSPERVARTITRAIDARHPRTRYLVGTGARALVLARHVLPDRLLDQLLLAGLRRGR